MDSLRGRGVHGRIASSQAKHDVKCGLLLDVVVAQGTAVLGLLASEDEAHVLAWDALLLLDLGLQVVDGVRGPDIQCDGLAIEGLHEELHAATKTYVIVLLIISAIIIIIIIITSTGAAIEYTTLKMPKLGSHELLVDLEAVVASGLSVDRLV